MRIRRAQNTRRAIQGIGFSLDRVRCPRCSSVKEMKAPMTVSSGQYLPGVNIWIIQKPSETITINNSPIEVCAWIRFAIISLIDGTVQEFTAEGTSNVEVIGQTIGYNKSTKEGIIGFAAESPYTANTPPSIILNSKNKVFPPCAIIAYELDLHGKGELALSYNTTEDFSPNCSDQLYFSVTASIPATLNAQGDDSDTYFDFNMPEIGAITSSNLTVGSNGGAGPFNIGIWADAPGYSGSGNITVSCTFDSSC